MCNVNFQSVAQTRKRFLPFFLFKITFSDTILDNTGICDAHYLQVPSLLMVSESLDRAAIYHGTDVK